MIRHIIRRFFQRRAVARLVRRRTAARARARDRALMSHLYHHMRVCYPEQFADITRRYHLTRGDRITMAIFIVSIVALAVLGFR